MLISRAGASDSFAGMHLLSCPRRRPCQAGVRSPPRGHGQRHRPPIRSRSTATCPRTRFAATNANLCTSILRPTFCSNLFCSQRLTTSPASAVGPNTNQSWSTCTPAVYSVSGTASRPRPSGAALPAESGSRLVESSLVRRSSSIVVDHLQLVAQRRDTPKLESPRQLISRLGYLANPAYTEVKWSELFFHAYVD